MQPRTALALLLSLSATISFSQAQHPRHPAHSPSRTAAAASVVPDDIYFNAVIYTGSGFAEDKPQVVQAMAVSKGRILAIGGNGEITRLKKPGTRLHDVDSASNGVFLFPGFNDAHTHLGEAGQQQINLDLAGSKSLADMLAKTEEFAARQPAGHWISGGGWDQTLWQEKVLPTRQNLDKITGGRPTFLDRVDGHIAIANSAALKIVGISGKSAPPQGGAIDLDEKGEPTGILRESAKGLVSKIIPKPSVEEVRRGVALAIADALSHGVTSVQDNSNWADFLAYEQMEKDGKLGLRITEWLPFSAPLEQLKQARAHHDADDPMLHTGMLKGFMDGSLGSQTAALNAPYADAPQTTGLPQYKQEDLNRMTLERARAGFQIGFHAIGDKAAAMALEAYSQAGVSSTARNRIEHAQVVAPEDIARFKRLGVIASMQPNHLLTDMNWAETRLGARRAAYSYAWKAFLDAGVPLAFGTDYPVEPITPFRGLYCAVTRMNEKGSQTYYPANKLTRGQALYAYTQGSAYAEFAEKRKGKLVPGYDADFIVVDRDLYLVGAPAILFTKVVQTFVGGRQVFPALQ